MITKVVNAAFVAGFLLAVSAPVYAADAPKTKAECTKAKMKWDDTAKKCSKK
ncbi:MULTISPECIES: hypothetical protein [Rhodomicrobium]|uniref:hypothetical protein n=1 Tax=Rhodomicrobium TaxID=1068 RepID=UPI0014820242|nr:MULTISPECIES: hypothetical protein [Rhodomicrobium]